MGLVDLDALAILIVVVLILVDVAEEYAPGLYAVEKIDAVADYVPNLNVIYALLNLVVAVVDVGSVGCSSFKCSGNCSCTFPLFQCFPYCAEILDFNGQLKYYVFLENKCSYFSKCLKRRAGLDFNICDVNKNPICTISGRNNKDFGAFFEDSYSYEINFPPDADADIKLILLKCVFALDALCVY